ncbi:Glucosamine 6-phosphate N-acetyltransferase [Mycena sanguinolenta]|uniref:Glucosamine 6-phosphate N-acetyltransferase n=1 Tax=Mycena sanguinolenta TaxID=230812 RepID=A0A8H6ZF55_9AGAR|nr:Glucosamine 6-phosphate N-acetyltransferase [Mycena sanguinolenta]
MSSSKIISTEIVFGQGDDAQAILPDCYRLRKEVFHIEQGISLDTEYDGADNIAVHFLLRVTEHDPVSGESIVKGVGTIRVTTPDVYPAVNRYKLSRMAVDKGYRQHRFGRLLVARLHEWIQEHAKATNRPAEVECYSHIFTMGFYTKFGYIPEGEKYNKKSGPNGHLLLQKMVLRLPLL